MIGMRPRQVSTGELDDLEYSSGSIEKNSPVPPAANSAEAPYGMSHSRRPA
jgi:hypothetical protein